MDNGQLLRQAIKDHPREVTVRLVYADWLEENDQPERADLVRLSQQVHLSADEEEIKALEARIKQLVKDHKASWCRPGLSPEHVEYRGGMPFVHLDIGCFFHHIEPLLVTHPDIIGVNIIDDYRDTRLKDRAVRSPLLINFNHLTFSGLNPLTDSQVETLAQNPATTRLTHLSLPVNEMSDSGARALATSSYLCGLVSLAVRTLHLTPGGFASLSSGTYSGSIEHLDLSFCRLGDSGLRALAENGPPMINLKELKLHGSWLTRDGLAALAASGRFPETAVLKVSRLRGCDFTGTTRELVTALASGRGLTRDGGWDR